MIINSTLVFLIFVMLRHCLIGENTQALCLIALIESRVMLLLSLIYTIIIKKKYTQESSDKIH